MNTEKLNLLSERTKLKDMISRCPEMSKLDKISLEGRLKKVEKQLSEMQGRIDTLQFVKKEDVEKKISLHFNKIFNYLISKWMGDEGEIPGKIYDDFYKKFFTTLHDFF